MEHGKKLGELLGVPFTPENPAAPRLGHVPPALELMRGLTAEIWLQKKNRAGKSVSLLKVPGARGSSLGELAAHLKRSLSCGGSYKNGEIVIQQPDRDKVRMVLEKIGLKAKLCGG